MWVVFAFGSALFAGLTAILAKVGIRGTDTDVATALRTIVVLVFSWLMAWVTGSITGLEAVSGRTWLFLGLSGLATGASWLCYFRALQMGDVNKVTPIDKSSTVLTMLLAALVLGEGITLLKAVCMLLIGGGAFLMIQRKAAPALAAGAGVQPSPAAQGAVDARDVPSAQAAAPVQNMAAGQTVIATQVVAPAQAVALAQAEAPAQAVAPAQVAAPAQTMAGAQIPAPANTVVSTQSRSHSPAWLLYALGSAVFASLTSILGKIGIEGINATLGTAVRTGVVLVMAWCIVFLRGKQGDVRRIHKTSYLFLALSGIATGASWLCYYRALQTGPASVVVPIDKLSILVSIAFSRIVFGERLTLKAGVGLALLVAGTLLLLV